MLSPLVVGKGVMYDSLYAYCQSLAMAAYGSSPRVSLFDSDGDVVHTVDGVYQSEVTRPETSAAMGPVLRLGKASPVDIVVKDSVGDDTPSMGSDGPRECCVVDHCGIADRWSAWNGWWSSR
jgi:hypothetical protein